MHAWMHAFFQAGHVVAIHNIMQDVFFKKKIICDKSLETRDNASFGSRCAIPFYKRIFYA